jgi:L-alanine-DL-glutamate epimerase-like enolase superfamily enzyme
MAVSPTASWFEYLDIAAGASDLAMVDIMKIGGITGWVSAMAQAEAAALPYQTTLLSSRARM